MSSSLAKSHIVLACVDAVLRSLVQVPFHSLLLPSVLNPPPAAQTGSRSLRCRRQGLRGPARCLSRRRGQAAVLIRFLRHLLFVVLVSNGLQCRRRRTKKAYL